MNDYFKRYKIPIFVLIPLLIIAGLLVLKLTNRYISQVKILGPVSVSFKGVTSDEADQIKINGFTPFNNDLQLIQKSGTTDWIFNNYGSFKNLYVSGPDKILKHVEKIQLKTGNKIYTIDNHIDSALSNKIELLQYLKTRISGTQVLVSMLHWNITRSVILLLLVFGFILVVNKLFKSGFQWIGSKLEKVFPSFRSVFAVCLFLFISYTIVFFSIVRYNNTVEIRGDYFGYQYKAVNIAFGKELHGKTFFEKYKLDENNIDKKTGYEFYMYGGKSTDIPYPPMYPIFLAGIYKVFGVSPAIARYAQLLLLVFVAAFLPLLGFLFRKGKGALVGIISGLLFIIIHYRMANEIMTESLQIFTILFVLFALFNFEKENKAFPAVILGITLAVSLLVKGIIIFVPLIYFICLFYRAIRNKALFKNFAILILSFVLSLLPWMIYANIQTEFFSIRKYSDDQLHKIITELDKIFVDTEGFSYFGMLDKLEQIPGTEIFINDHVIEYLKKTVIENPLLSEDQKNDSIISLSKLFKAHLNDLSRVDKSISLKIGDNSYLCINIGKFVFLSDNPDHTLLESNNISSLDGDWHKDDLIVLNYDRDSNSPAIFRVFRFYLHNPSYLAVIVPNKLFLAYRNFPFFTLLLVLILADFIKFFFLKKSICQFNNCEKIALITLIGVISYVCLISKLAFIVCFSGAIIVICLSAVKKKPLILFHLPVSFLIFILNFILITLIFYGSERFLSIVNFIVILSALFYLSEFVTRLGNFNNGTLRQKNQILEVEPKQV